VIKVLSSLLFEKFLYRETDFPQLMGLTIQKERRNPMDEITFDLFLKFMGLNWVDKGEGFQYALRKGDNNIDKTAS
jgi:hypothetical protein